MLNSVSLDANKYAERFASAQNKSQKKMQVHVSNDQHIMMATEMQDKQRLMTAKTDMRKDSDFVGRANKLKS